MKSKVKYHMVLDDPEYKDHALALGRMLGHWGELEACLMLMTKFLLGTDYDEKAYFVYKEFYAIKNKIKLLIRLNNNFTNNETDKDDIDILLSKADKLNDRRNAFIHARWNPQVGYGEVSNKLMRISLGPGKLPQPNKKPKYFTPQNIQGFGADIAKLAQCFYDLLARVSPEP